MADRSPKVMEMVVQELDRNPDVELDALYRKAQEVDPGIGELSLRQFHARYPLQAKRQRNQQQGKRSGKGRASKKAAGERGGRGGRKDSARSAEGRVSREEVRRILLEFAGDFARAETKPEIVKVLGGVDGYVDRIVKLAAG